jgi:acyl-CoA synthetase (AMP-forming)/AMP-acid ligase II
MLSMVPPPQLPSFSESEHNWVVPPLDGSLNLPQILHFNYMNNGDKPLFAYANTDGSLRRISWRTAVCAAYGVAATLSKSQIPNNSVVAILAQMDFATYWAYVHGILVAGYQPFPVSPRNSAPIVAHLLKITGASAIITNADGGSHRVAMVALDELKETLHHSMLVLIARSFDEIFDNNDQNIPNSNSAITQTFASLEISDLDAQALILHSSGRHAMQFSHFFVR